MYEISFDIIALFMTVILLIVHFVLFDNKQKVHILFQLFLLATAAESILDILTARIIDGGLVLSDPVCVWLNALYFASTYLTAFVGYRLISYRFDYTNVHTKASSATILGVGLLALIINGFTGIFFSFEQGEYIKTPAFIFVNTPSFLFLVLLLIFIILYRLRRENGKMAVPAFFVLIELLTFWIQFFCPDILLTALGKAMAGIGFCLYLDLPEHMKLIEVVDELKESQLKQFERIAELNEAVRQKNEFLIKMSHELKTPINAILGFNSIILVESDEEDVKKEAADIVQRGNDLLDIVNRIVDFAQIETGKLELNEVEYDIVGAYLAVHNKLLKVCENTGFSLEHNFSPETPKRLYGDTKKINLILEEMAKLFIQEMEAGVFNWNVSVNRIEYNVVYVEIGIGCNGSRKKNLTAQKTENFNYGIIEKLSECMNGELLYPEDSDDAIRFIFPQEIVDLKPVGDLDKAIEKYLEKKKDEEDGENFVMPEARILAVDDIDINLDILEGILEPYRLGGFTKALSGEEALEIMRKKAFDFVFMDIMMPGIDGVETLKRIRSEEGIISSDIPVVALTANTFLGAKDKYLADGFADYIPKPIERSSLAKAFMQFIPDKVQSEWAEMDIADIDMELEQTSVGDISSHVFNNDYKPISSLEEIEVLDYESGLELCGGDGDIYREVLSEYCKDNSIDRLKDCFEKKNWDEYRVIIHGLKSTSKTVGLNALSEKARELEFAARDANYSYIENNHAAWIEEYNRVVDEVRGIL
ncbi:MAG: response regulator [Lachnospiraceae bacterium]|nr:response regulator [Candidatus Colinaster scatohippi]